ncbi:hypothetical protein SS50377_23204 [Spironucleus salmonicida]|uniref:Uncharacterized protein n=1 Tax=Spironucleus salmonicida TaxID=348837 RepID=A0A9P8RZW2_9EUKA|nr:hypothetical protein SS50377_23204 [Spironucleus salmonicida]
MFIQLNSESAGILAIQELQNQYNDQLIIYMQILSSMNYTYYIKFPKQFIDELLVKKHFKSKGAKVYKFDTYMMAFNIELNQIQFTEQQISNYNNAIRIQQEITTTNQIHPIMIIIIDISQYRIVQDLKQFINKGLLLKQYKQGQKNVIGMLFPIQKINIQDIRDIILPNYNIFSQQFITKNKFLLPLTISHLTFTTADWQQVCNINSKIISAKQMYTDSTLIGPNFIMKFSSLQQQSLILDKINSVFVSGVITKTCNIKNSFYASILYAANYIDYRIFWYLIPKEIQRFQQHKPIMYPPKFCLVDAFPLLCYTQSESQNVQISKIVYNKKNSIGMNFLIYVETDTDIEVLKNYCYTFPKMHIFFQYIGNYFSILVHDGIINHLTIKQFLNSQFEYNYSLLQFKAKQLLLSSQLFLQLSFPTALLDSLNDIYAFYQSNNINKKLIQQSQAQNQKIPIRQENKFFIQQNIGIIFIDFEAFYYDRINQYPSECGISIVINDQKYQSYHFFIKQDNNIFDQFTEIQKEKLSLIEKITNIPYNKSIVPQENYFSEHQLEQFIKDLKRFSSFNLQQKYLHQLVSSTSLQYEYLQEPLFVAKGINLENLILNQKLKLQCSLIEFENILCGQQINLEDMHSLNRQYQYCEYHQHNHSDLCQVHCALDDCRYLESKFLNRVIK